MIEAMLATIFLVSGVVAIIPLISFSLREAIDSRDQVIAGMLVQEGAELVQNLRDNNWIQSPPKTAFDGGTFPGGDADNCRIDFNDTDIKTCDSSSKVLNLISGNYYAHDAGAPTKFQRKIKLDFINSDTQLIVVSVVIWGGVGASFPASIDATTCNTLSKCAFTKTTLTNWKM